MAECSRAATDGVQYWPVFLRDESAPGGYGAHVGAVGLRRYAATPTAYAASCRGLSKVMEFGFHLRPEHWRKGLAVEAGTAVLRHAFETLQVDAVFAGHNPKNEGSRKTLLKLGLEYTHDRLFPRTGLLHPSYLLKAFNGGHPPHAG